MRQSDIYTLIFFKDGREKLIKGLSRADKYAEDHADEILFAYTDHTGGEHLDATFRKLTQNK